jgi:hypothetical protein
MVAMTFLVIFVEPPKLLLIVGGDDDVLRNDIGLSYNFCCNQDDYTNAIQTCMEEAYSGACHSWHEFDGIHGSMFYSSHHSMEIPACIYLAFDVSLFWLMTKHKGRGHGIDEVLRWLH